MTQLLLKNRRGFVDALQAVAAALALAASFSLRFEFSLGPRYIRMLLESLPLLLAAKLTVFRVFGLRDLAWRYLGFQDLLRIAGANLAASAAATVALRLAIGSLFPRSIHIIDLLVTTALLVTAHAAAKMFFDSRRGGNRAPPRRIAIFGAGRAGVILLGEIQSNPQNGYEAIGFFDDDPLKRGLRIHGVKVLGGLADLAALARKRRIEMVLIAIPAATGHQIAAILEKCQRASVAAKRIPALAELMGNRVLVDQIRDVRIEDLLGRPPVQLAVGRIHSRLKDRVVLVTGAGGSIGSELCRQIARFEPAALVGLDHAETALYEIDRELRARFPGVAFHPEVGSIQNPRRLEEIFREHGPQSVYHAAAYKHVPLMETHLFEAVENNVFGTRNVARAAAAFGAEDFVLISSDKAVRPANVMGATKRLAEMVSQAQGQSSGNGRFISVRFGNVLGSSGSVIPLFKQQIAAGGPLTVTHPEMRRFFMTIPEAAQLVLEAAAMGRGGEIFVLEMGAPVRIADLARHMIQLSGLKPEDIRIEFSGIRPGEKLYEELSAHEEATVPTSHSQIRVFSGRNVCVEALARGLEALRVEVEEGDPAAVVDRLKELVPDYNPSGFLQRRAYRERARGVFA
jgi:FlaA1/EpsC-like NDP-sugar epimerase